MHHRPSPRKQKNAASTGYGFVRRLQSVTRRGPDTSVHRTSISVIHCSGSSQLPSCSRTHPWPQVLSEPVGIRSAIRSHTCTTNGSEREPAGQKAAVRHSCSLRWSGCYSSHHPRSGGTSASQPAPRCRLGAPLPTPTSLDLPFSEIGPRLNLGASDLSFCLWEMQIFAMPG